MDFFSCVAWRDDVIRSDRGWQSGGGDPLEMILMINSNQVFLCLVISLVGPDSFA